MKIHPSVVGLAAAGVLLLSACGQSSGTGPSAAAGSGTSAPASTSAPTESGPAMDSGDPQTDIPTAPITPSGAPQMSDASRTPADVGYAVMSAYVVSQPVDPDTWYSRVAPYLTPEARRDYVYVDPTRVKAHVLLGQPTVTRQTDYLAEVTMGSDAGTYIVHLVRDDNGQWKVTAIDEPLTPGS